MAFTYRQSTSSASSGTGTDTTSYPSNLLAGSLLIVSVFWNDTAQPCPTSDSLNGAYTALGSPQNGADGLAAWRGQIFYKLNSAAGPASVTSTIGGGSSADMGHAIHEYRSDQGGAAVALDAGPTYSNPINQVGSTTTGAVVTTVAADLLFAWMVCETSVTTAGSGFVLRENVNGNGSEDDTDAGVIGSKTAGFNLTGTADVILGLVAFRDQAPSATTGPGDNPPIGFIGRGAGW